MALEGPQEPELPGQARGRVCSLPQEEQDTAVGSSFSGSRSQSLRSIPALPAASETAELEQEGRRVDMGSDSLGLSPASATLQPWDFGQSTQGAQRPLLHLQSEDNSAKHPPWPFLWGKSVLLYI